MCGDLVGMGFDDPTLKFTNRLLERRAFDQPCGVVDRSALAVGVDASLGGKESEPPERLRLKADTSLRPVGNIGEVEANIKIHKTQAAKCDHRWPQSM